MDTVSFCRRIAVNEDVNTNIEDEEVDWADIESTILLIYQTIIHCFAVFKFNGFIALKHLLLGKIRSI